MVRVKVRLSEFKMPTLTRSKVNRYIDSAHPFVTSPIEEEVIHVAFKLNSFPDRPRKPTVKKRYKGRASKRRRAPMLSTYVGTILASASATTEPKPIISAQQLIRQEIHLALCKKSSRYSQHVRAISHSVDVLILGVSAYVAEKIKMSVVVVASLVAAFLRIILAMGVSVFCKKYEGRAARL
jgi:hypothetical protein